ncbi:metallophosphoesterase [Sphingobacterium thermophilum]|uniref:Metallophosphoesterase n=1 Tax=Sphingobacterium thermophilum TaxID=768534 RepID=A0ABP8QU29_9SPHI
MSLHRILVSLILCLGCTFAVAQSLRKESKNRKLKILLISDLNDSYGSVTYSKEVHDVVARIKDIKPDLILCGGDMVAGQKALLTASRLDSMWLAFGQYVLEPIAQLGIPFGFTVGNHDASPSYKLDRAAASSFWIKNKQKTNLVFVDDTYYPYYYSYMKDNVFFISWDASSAVIPESVKQWMAVQLEQPIAKQARARIVLGHLPLYAIVASKNKKGEVLNEADATLEFLRKHGVDMYISGHQHAYYPATKEELVLLHAGCLGGGPRPLLRHTAPATKAYALITLPKRKGIEAVEITGYEPAFHSHISLETLPDSVSGFNGTVFKWRK